MEGFLSSSARAAAASRPFGGMDHAVRDNRGSLVKELWTHPQILGRNEATHARCFLVENDAHTEAAAAPKVDDSNGRKFRSAATRARKKLSTGSAPPRLPLVNRLAWEFAYKFGRRNQKFGS